MGEQEQARQSVSFAIVGTGGAGAITAGSLLLEAAGKAGYAGILTRSVGPQIRGGEAAALVRLATDTVECMPPAFDILVAIDWKNADRFLADMPVAAGGLVVADPSAGEVPTQIGESGAQVIFCPMKELAAGIEGGRENMIAVGLVARLTGLPLDVVNDVFASKLARKGEAVVQAGLDGIRAGAQQAAAFGHDYPLAPARPGQGKRWLITGNEATGLGAIRGGVRFAAAYPITPATDVLEWLAPALHRIGGTLVQAEDELSSINMIMGASFGGRASITATSGPGLALMMEGLGLSAASETPVVVVDVMRCGPSTGIATKSEQSDLNIAVYGFHGDAPHVVLAPLGVADCLFTTQWAVHVAETLQCPAIILSDQSIGQARVLIERPADVAFIGGRKTWAAKTSESGTDYLRYAITADGVSPMALPGTAGGQYTADGLTHAENGNPSSRSFDQKNQMDKRQRKIEQFDFGDRWGVAEGSGTTVILTWGSLTGAAREAARMLADDGTQVRLVALRQMLPFPTEGLARALEGAQRILIVEQSHAAQFHRYLKAHADLPGEVRRLNREGPRLIGPEEITATIKEWSDQ